MPSKHPIFVFEGSKPRELQKDISQRDWKEINPIKALANAIIMQAVDDFRVNNFYLHLIRGHEDEVNPKNIQEAKRQRYDAEHFFMSRWFRFLTEIDPNYLLGALKAEPYKSDRCAAADRAKATAKTKIQRQKQYWKKGLGAYGRPTISGKSRVVADQVRPEEAGTFGDPADD